MTHNNYTRQQMGLPANAGEPIFSPDQLDPHCGAKYRGQGKRQVDPDEFPAEGDNFRRCGDGEAETILKCFEVEPLEDERG